jgi:tetratricopeptide (TPR) repeat protein
LVTAAHVLDDVGRKNAPVGVDPLEGGGAIRATVAGLDHEHDIAILTSEERLPAVAGYLAYADAAPLRTGVSVTGHAVIDDGDHQYRYLVATGEWAGPTERDGILLGSMTAARTMRGMSGAPVIMDSDRMVVGLVSGRYNSADSWLVGNVWVARTEDLVSLLRQLPDVRVDHVLRMAQDVTVVLRVASGSGPSGDRSLGRLPSGAGLGGIREAAWEGAKLLAALDEGAQGVGALAEFVLDVAARAAAAGHDEREVEEFHRRMAQRGLDPRLIVRDLPWHNGAVERWNERIPNLELSSGVADSPSMLASFTSVLSGDLPGSLFSELSDSCVALLQAALAGQDTTRVRAFLWAVDEMLPVRRSTTREVALYRPPDDEQRSSDRPRTHLTYRENGLRSAASQLCRLPDADPCTRGRDMLINSITRAFVKVLETDGAASCFLSGQPGIGTSTVAIEVARRLASEFPGGVWYVNLYGLVPGSRRDARTAVRLLAEAMSLNLGTGAMDDEQMFGEFAEQFAWRRALVVLDNAADAAHVERLARPPSGCGVLVNSRDRLQDYASPGLVFAVGALDHGSAVEVLEMFAGADAGDQSQLDVLARLCDHVPLALRLVGARMAVRPPIELEYLVHLLSEERNRLEYLKVGERAVRAAIQLSYDALDKAAQKTLCFITAVPGSAASAQELGNGLGEPYFQQEILLNRLEDHSLVQHKLLKGYRVGPSMPVFSPFELVRLFAQEKLVKDVPVEEISAFQRRSVTYLSDTLQQIIQKSDDVDQSWELDPTRFHAALRIAEERGWLELARRLARNLHAFYVATPELDSVLEISEVLINLHLQSGDYKEAAQTCMRTAKRLDDADMSIQAVSYARRAHEIAFAHSLPLVAAEADFVGSLLLIKQDDLPGALAASERAANALIDLGHSATAVPPALNSCKIALEQKYAEKAVSWGRRAVELTSRAGTTAQQAAAAFECAWAEQLAGNLFAAVEMSRQSAAHYTEIRAWWNAAVAFRAGAFSSRTMGDTAHAAEMFSSAVDRWEQLTTEEGMAQWVDDLINLSSVQAEMSAFGQARASLERARSLIEQWPQSISAVMRYEAHVRQAAVNLFLEEASGSFQEKAAIRVRDSLDDGNGQHAMEPDPELDRVTAVVRRYTDGKISNAQARDLIIDFLATPTRHHPEGIPLWLYEDANFELNAQAALGTKPPTKGKTMPRLGGTV